MKQHYRKGSYIILFILLAATYVAKMHKFPSIKSIPDNPASVKSEISNDQSAPVHDTTMASIQQSLAVREYNISFDSEKNTLQSPNRRQGLRAFYGPGLLTIKNRVDSAGHNFSLKLVNEGIFADGLKILSAQSDATLENGDNKLQIKHKGFTEEFINNEEGVRQNFIIDSAPADTKELQVRLSAQGLNVTDFGNNELHFYANNKQGKLTNSLIYKDIKCWDADGDTLLATMRYENGLIALSVNVQNATYPITIDPIVVNGNPANANAIVVGNQAGAQAGYAVSSAGDVNGDGYSDVIVGAPFFDKGESNEGIAFVYHGSASGIAPNPAIILEGNQIEAQFGTSAASAGDINKDGFSDIIIGAPFYNKGESKEGVAMIYYGSASGISNNKTILEGNQPNAKFGRAVEGLGDVNGDGFSDVIVGAPLYDKGQTDEGAAFIYHGSAAGINLLANNILEGNQEKSQYGYVSTAAGDVNGDGYNDVLVGAYAYDKGHDNEGAVFVHLGSAIGVGNNASVVLEGNQINAQYGWSATTAGDVNGDGYSDILVGSYLYDFGQTNEGAVFVYHGSAQGIKASAALRLESNQAEAKQGISVACAGDVNGDGYSDVMIGVWQYDKGEGNEGTVVIHHGSPNGLISSPASTLESNQADAGFGWSVKSAGDVNGDGYSDVIAGANTYDKGQADEGAAFVWLGMAKGENANSLQFQGYQDDCLFGMSVATAGDVNADSFSDIIVGAPSFDVQGRQVGAAYIYYGSIQGINLNTPTKIENVPGSGDLGGSVASAGDVNGDGYDDIIIGDINYEQNFDPKKGVVTFGGAALIYYGSSQGISINNSSILKFTDNETNGRYGSSVASAGDLNGDGYDDVVVGDPYYDKQFDEGAVFVYYGSAQGVNANAAMVFEGNQSWEQLGISVASAGDINSDGFDEIIVGAPDYSNGQDMEGAAFLFYGSALGVNKVPTILESNSAGAFFGQSVSGAGDVNGDGFVDIAVGSPLFMISALNQGATFVYYGSQNGINNNSSKTILEIGQTAHFGSSVSEAGDFNGDGYADIIVGAIYYPPLDRGAAFVFLGSSTGISLLNPIKFDGNLDYSQTGSSVAGAGDVNGDGYSDVLVGSPYFQDLVSVYKGNNGKGLQNNLRLYNSNLTTPINLSQKAKNDFGAGLYAKSFLGKNKGKLVWETKAMGQAFSKGANNVITNSTMLTGSQNVYASLGLTGTELKCIIAKQGPSTKVRVRVKYDPALALTGQIYSPWRYLPAYLLGNSIAPTPEDVVDDMSETVKRKAEESMAVKEGETIYVYPNPAFDKLILKTEGADRIKSVQLLTVDGRSVYRSSGPVSEIDVRNFSAGKYILLITHGDGSNSSRKVVIEK
ncbi:FG-GAP-like repeat-containing protein [Dyadobacter psychrophilus]|uniref:Por secretion system C-terminal sorting domain-containing protein n=1 Tax=Dyadobacter psychrophilus TaxID=651661 RepID=A0A1T5GCC1_9BACT|nr:FG-GAP-like repeat-containing protein [Dyadobacter psychrophilus]SKC06046.1 Por secretion system C-terminal sorting domain-containing protein [Dyadobacter psychrophilus]